METSLRAHKDANVPLAKFQSRSNIEKTPCTLLIISFLLTTNHSNEYGKGSSIKIQRVRCQKKWEGKEENATKILNFFLLQKKLGKASKPIGTHQNPSKPIETHQNPSEPIETHRNPVETPSKPIEMGREQKRETWMQRKYTAKSSDTRG